MFFLLFHFYILASYSLIESVHLTSIEDLAINRRTLLFNCPPRPSGGLVKILSDNDYTQFSDSVVYGCNVHMSKQLKLNRGILQVYNCMFHSIKESSIYLSLIATQILNSNLKKPIEIFGCNFKNCYSNNGAAIFINSTEITKSITISECQFNGLTASQGGAIYYLYTYDSSISSYDLIKDEYALSIQDSIFYNITAQTFGGAICVIAPKGQSNRPIEIKNCSFNNCSNFDGTNECKGGAIYFSSSEILRRFNVLHSNFTSCHTNSFGGSIYFNSILGNIRDCNFLNNFASKGGCDIFYESGSLVSTTEKLAIFKNIFRHDDDEEDFLRTLIYMTFSDVSIFDFDSNQIELKNSLKNVFVFGYDLDHSSYKGSLTITSNCLSPPDNNLYEQGNVLSTRINFYSAFSKQCESQQCPTKLANSVDVGQSGIDESDKVLYSCSQQFGPNEIKSTNCVLDIFKCTFTATLKDHFPIQISINSNLPNGMIGPTKIRNCLFNDCGSEAVHIESSDAKMCFDIVGCSFSHNKNGAVYFKAVYGLIQKCYFLDNSADGVHKDIQYECSLAEESSQEEGQKLTIFDSTFNLTFKDVTGQNHGSFIYVYFNAKSNLDFNNNKVIIDGSLDSAENLFVFDCPENSVLKGSWNIKDNCLSPPNDKFIKSGNIPDGFLTDIDSAFKDTCLAADCPAMIEGSTVLWDGNYKETDVFEDQSVYACGQYLDTHVQLNRCMLKIYYCIFTSCRPDSANRGGAIFISADESMAQESNEAVEIFNCQFNGCEEDSGGAIYIHSSDCSRLFDIRSCTFDHNKAVSSGSSPGFGGSIYMNATLVNIEKCTFSSNTGKNGASIYILSYVANVESQNIVIKDCTFEKNEAEIIGSDIYYNFDSSRSSISSKTLLDTNKVVFNITNNTFTKSASAQNGGSIALKLVSHKHDQIIVNNCSFNECASLKYGGAFYYECDNYTTPFEIFDCSFESSKANSGSSIYMTCCNCNIERCHFINNLQIDEYGSAISYRDNNYYGFGQRTGTITVVGCKFDQTDEISSLFNYMSHDSTRVLFNNNDVRIYNNNTACFDTSYSSTGDWNFEGNTIIPPYDTYIKSSRATVLSCSCNNGFLCILPTDIPTKSGLFGTCNDNERCVFDGIDSDPDFVVITSSSFNDFECIDNGGAVYLKNCGLKCDDTKFTNCSANSGGGGIYIYINKVIPAPVELSGLFFEKCYACFGGAVYIYSSIESINVLIDNCKFVSNKVTQSENSNSNDLSGGSSLYLTVKSGCVNNCEFNKNSGFSFIKVTNKFEGDLLEDEIDRSSSISFADCQFEIDNKSNCSFYYLKENKNSVFVNLKNCVFIGKLSKSAHHIETKDLSGFSYSSKLVLENCKFATDAKSAIKTDSAFNVIYKNKHEFNYNHKIEMIDENCKSKKLVLLIIFISTLLGSVVVFKLNTKNLDDIEDDNQL